MKTLLLAALLLLSAQYAHATATLSQHRSVTGCLGTTSCNVTGFSAIPAGSLAFELIINDAGGTNIVASTGASGAGNWVIPSTCTGTGGTACAVEDSDARSVAVAYILSTVNNPTTMTCTAANAQIRECVVIIVTFTGASMSFDVGATRVATTGTNLAGVSAGTLTGTSDVFFQYGTFSSTASGCPNSGTGDFPNGNAGCTGPLNSTNNAAGNYTNTSGTAALGAVAFKEAPGFRTQVGAFLTGP